MRESPSQVRFEEGRVHFQWILPSKRILELSVGLKGRLHLSLLSEDGHVVCCWVEAAGQDPIAVLKMFLTSEEEPWVPSFTRFGYEILKNGEERVTMETNFRSAYPKELK